MSKFLEKGVTLNFRELLSYLERGIPDPKLKLKSLTGDTGAPSSFLVWDEGETTGSPTLVWEDDMKSMKFNSATIQFRWEVISTSAEEIALKEIKEAVSGDMFDLFDTAHDNLWESFYQIYTSAYVGGIMPSEKDIIELQNSVQFLDESCKDIVEAYYK